MNMRRVKRAVERMLREFPSEQVELLHPVRDAYGQPTGDRSLIGTAECWREGMSRPGKWQTEESGTRYGDESAFWICLLWSEQLPEARHEDIVRFADGSEYAVKNIQNRMNVRVYWQLADRRDPV